MESREQELDFHCQRGRCVRGGHELVDLSSVFVPSNRVGSLDGSDLQRDTITSSYVHDPGVRSVCGRIYHQ